INDAAMQALGSYKGGTMLFLGLGTGLGSAMIVDGVLEPMELAHLPYKKKTWERQVFKAVQKLRDALQADYVVLGGGNTKKLKKLPPHTIAGDNRNAFIGGFRLWGGGVDGRGATPVPLITA